MKIRTFFDKLLDPEYDPVDDSLESYPTHVLGEFLREHPMPHPPYNRTFEPEENFALSYLNSYYQGTSFFHEHVYELLLVASLSMTPKDRFAHLAHFYRDQFATQPRLRTINEVKANQKDRKYLESLYFPPAQRVAARQALIKQVLQTIGIPLDLVLSAKVKRTAVRSDIKVKD